MKSDPFTCTMAWLSQEWTRLRSSLYCLGLDASWAMGAVLLGDAHHHGVEVIAGWQLLMRVSQP